MVNYFAPEAIRNAVLAIPGVGTKLELKPPKVSSAGFLLFRGPFSEITRGWYAVVGAKIKPLLSFMSQLKFN